MIRYKTGLRHLLLSACTLWLSIIPSLSRADDEAAIGEKLDRQYEAAQAQERKKEIAMRKLCGDEYHKPRVGMTLARINECVGKAVMLGQVNRVDGVVSTYQAGYYYIHVSNNKVIAWARR